MAERRELLLCTLGTRGDLQPFLALAAELMRRSYPVRLLSNANWRSAAEAIGAAFEPIAEEDDPQDDRDDHAFFMTNTLPSFRRSFEIIAERSKAGRPPGLVYRGNMLGAECAAARLGLASARVFLQPSAIRSYIRPPWPLSIVTEGRAGWFGRRLLLPAMYTLGETFNPRRAHTKRFRRAVGVPMRRASAPPRAGEVSLLMCPEWFALPQADWPPGLRMVGFPFADIAPGSAEMQAFLASNEPPVVFTPGTGIRDPVAFFDRAAEVLETLGMPGIFLSPSVPERHRGRPGIFCEAYAELGWLLPQARALVHHGGIGSTAQALRAGIPQLVIPNRFDQPDNAMRVAQLGLGGAVLAPRYSGREWAGLLEEMLRRPHIRAQLATAAHLIAGQDAIANAADAIEQNIGDEDG